jgi:hypothetical protein
MTEKGNWLAPTPGREIQQTNESLEPCPLCENGLSSQPAYCEWCEGAGMVIMISEAALEVPLTSAEFEWE